MEANDLREAVLAFVGEVSPVVMVSDGEIEAFLSVEDTLAMWMQVPDSSYSSMFLGWALAQGYDISSFSPDDLAHAVQTALVGENKNVMFDWLGDTDVNNKPH